MAKKPPLLHQLLPFNLAEPVANMSGTYAELTRRHAAYAAKTADGEVRYCAVKKGFGCIVT